MIRRFLIAASLAVCSQIIPPAQAHEIRPGLLRFTEAKPQIYDVLWKRPAGGIAETIRLDLQLPAICRDLSQRVDQRRGTSWIALWRVQCPGGLEGHAIALKGLEETQMDVLVQMEPHAGRSQSLRLSPATMSAAFVRDPSGYEVVRDYFLLGVEHILGGIDHLLFVATLLMLSSGWRSLLAMVTAFTLAHSITLTLSILGHVSLAPAPVEALIALSIVLAASEGLKPATERSPLMGRMPWVMALAFGLLHGFGFAGALSDIGLPQNEVPLALLFFNLGVEAGQLAFIAALIGAFALFDRILSARRALIARKAVPYAAGCVGAFWFFERSFPLITDSAIAR